MTYIIVSEAEYKIRKWEVILTWDNAQDLLEYRDVFLKFLAKSKFSYQIELSKWTFKGKEQDLYRSIETIDELANSLWELEEAFKKHLETVK